MPGSWGLAQGLYMAQRSCTLTRSVGQCRAAFSVPEPLCQMQLTSVAITCLRNGHSPSLLLFFRQCCITIMVSHSSKSFYGYLCRSSFVTLGKALNHSGSCSLFQKENKSTFLRTPYSQSEKRLTQVCNPLYS